MTDQTPAPLTTEQKSLLDSVREYALSLIVIVSVESQPAEAEQVVRS